MEWLLWWKNGHAFKHVSIFERRYVALVNVIQLVIGKWEIKDLFVYTCAAFPYLCVSSRGATKVWGKLGVAGGQLEYLHFFYWDYSP